MHREFLSFYMKRILLSTLADSLGRPVNTFSKRYFVVMTTNDRAVTRRILMEWWRAEIRRYL